MQLTDIKPVESLPSGTIYSATSQQIFNPGQHLNYLSRVEILRCEPSASGFQLLIFSTEELPEDATFDLFGQSIHWFPDRPVTLFCEGIGNFTAIHWINSLRSDRNKRVSSMLSSLVFAETEAFKFHPVPSRYMTPEYPSNMIAAMPLLDDLGIISRLACEHFQPGCFEGKLDEMVAEMPQQPEHWAAMASSASIEGITKLIGKPLFAISTEVLES